MNQIDHRTRAGPDTITLHALSEGRNTTQTDLTQASFSPSG